MTKISQAPSAELEAVQIVQTPPGESPAVAARFPLPWTAFVRLLSVKDEAALPSYEAEAIPAGYSAGLDTAPAGGYIREWICSPLDQPQGLRRGFAFRGLPCR